MDLSSRGGGGWTGRWLLTVGLLFLLSSRAALAQISLSTAVNLALQNSPRIKLAQTDLDRAKAVLAETREYYVPSISATAGVGKGVGAPLSPPVVFSIAAQSLVLSFSQPDYIRSARAGLQSAQLALDVARTDVSEDTTNTYIALDNAERRRGVEADAFTIATRLVNIVQDRYAAGVDPHIELTRSRRTAAQIHLQELQVEDEIDANQEHLAMLTGLPATGFETVSASIPAIQLPTTPSATSLDDPDRSQGGSAAFAVARAREYTARGDERALQHPQISFSAQYSRLSDAFNTYDIYYPGFFGPPANPNSSNSLSAGVEITLPLLDMVRRSKARESAADAAHSLYDAQIQQANFIEGREKLRHSAAELAAHADLATLDHDLAQDELDAVMIRLNAASGAAGGPQSNPKDEQNARLAERQRTIDMLNAELQLHQAEVSLMRQEGSLTRFLGTALPGAIAAPGKETPSPAPALPPTLGATPASNPSEGNVPNGSTPAPVPTTGTPPSTLPSAPVSHPPSSAPQPGVPGTPETTPHD